VPSDAAAESLRRPRSLAAWVRALVACVDAQDRHAGVRLRDIAAGRRARIGLDDETVLVHFDGPVLVVTADDPNLPAHGAGWTDAGTVAAILAATVEATQAVLAGRVQIVGEPDAVTAMLHIVEILLDVSVRVPEMQRLGREFMASVGPSAAAPAPAPALAWYPHELTDAELDLLGELDLLPGGDG